MPFNVIFAIIKWGDKTKREDHIFISVFFPIIKSKPIII